MQYPNATWKKFSSHNIQEDVMIQTSSNLLHEMEQIKTELATLGQERINLRVQLQEHLFIAMEGISRARTPTLKGKQKTVRFCNYCDKIGHTPNWCRKKMRDEEIRKVRCELSSTRHHVPTQDHGTDALDHSAQYGQNVNLSLDWDDDNNTTTEVQTTEEEAGQDELNELTPPEPRFFHRSNGMSFRMAQFNSAEESDDELSDQFPLGCWSPRESFFIMLSFTFCMLLYSESEVFVFTFLVNSTSQLIRQILTALIWSG